MLKYQKLLQNSSIKKSVVLWQPKRTQSTGNKSSNLSKKIILGSAAFTGFASVGLISYISWSPSNREKVEYSVPFSKYLTNLLLGPLSEITEKKQIPLVNPASQDVGLLQKKLERERKQKEEDLKSEEVEPPIIETIPSLPNNNEISDTIEEMQVRTPIDLIETPDIQDEKKLSIEIDDLIKDAINQSSEALHAAEDVSSAIQNYYAMAYRAIDGIDDQWQDELFSATSQMANVKEELMRVAEEKLVNAKQSVSNLRKAIDVGHHIDNAEMNIVLPNVNEVVSELANEVAKVSSYLSDALRDCSAVGDLQIMVENGIKQFESEIKALLPDIKIDNSAQLSIDEYNMLLAHAHKKVLLLQASLARNKTLDKDKQIESEGSLVDYDSHYINNKIKIELDRQKHELSTAHRHRMAEMREELESQLLIQLKRQAAAHTDHLTDALRLQQSDLDRRWKNTLHDAVHEKQTQFNSALSSVSGQLEGLRQGINSRGEIIENADKSQKLWTACEALRTRLRISEGQTWENKLEPLKSSVEAIKKAAGNENEFVETVLNTLHADSLSRGVYTEDALRERFIKVEKICRRVALIGDNGGSLVKYFISYIQSFLLADSFDMLNSSDLKDEVIDITKLTTFDILARTKYCLSKDDLLQSVKYMNLLRGEPRNVASDWLREVCLTMEARQVADILMTFSAATMGKAL